MTPIYLDNNATTPLDPRVLKAMMADLGPVPANPSSVHSFGRQARARLLAAREKVAHFFRFLPEEVLFTSGGTESINLMLRSIPQGHIVTSAIEHSSIHNTLKSMPHETTFVAVDTWGAPLPEAIEAAIRPDTKALVFTLANTETGVKIDINAIADLAQKHKIPLLIDAVSYIGKEPYAPHPAITAIALSAHKFHGPKGVGALLCKNSFPLKSLFTGGMQEKGIRAGTQNLAGILGMAEALHLLAENQIHISKHIEDLRARFENTLLRALPGLEINGTGPRLCNTVNFAFPQVDGETLVIQLDQVGIATSHGAACSSGALEPSRVLTNMGLSRKQARSSLRFSFSRMNTREEIDEAVERIIKLLQ